MGWVSVVTEETLDQGRRRLNQVFGYLQALDQIRNPAVREIQEQPWVMWLSDLPSHSSVTISRPFGEATQSAADSDTLLRVRRPKLTRPPRLPDSIEGWVSNGWDDPKLPVVVRTSMNTVDANGETQVIAFSDDPQRVRDLHTWQQSRDSWAHSEIPAREAMGLFERLYELYGSMQREPERHEIVVGDGILDWSRDVAPVHHPILLLRLQLEFNPEIPEFLLRETEQSSEIYSAIFRSMNDIDGRVLAQCRKELDEGGYHPLGAEDTAGYLRRVVANLSPQGFYGSKDEQPVSRSAPRIYRDPVIFMRRRNAGFTSMIERVIEDLKKRDDLPPHLLGIAGVEASPPMPEVIIPEDLDLNSEHEEILLGKAANPEQVRIVERLENSWGVLVQGPPGTGKTHTIANLIGHLLARGKSVLVASHTTKALKVLRSQVAKEIQPLCVSILESDSEGQKQLGSAVAGIIDNLGNDESSLSIKVDRLSQKRSKAITKVIEDRLKILDARGEEYRDIVIAGRSYSPADAGRIIKDGRLKDDWIPSPVEPGVSPPISSQEVDELYGTNCLLSAKDEAELRCWIPDAGRLLSSERLSSLLRELASQGDAANPIQNSLFDAERNSVTTGDLQLLVEELHRLCTSLDTPPLWVFSAMSDGMRGGDYRRPWETLISLIRDTAQMAAGCRDAVLRYRPSLDGASMIPREEQLVILDEIITFLRGGGTLSTIRLLMKPLWRKLVAVLRVSNRQPTTLNHFVVLRDVLVLSIARDDIRRRWEAQIAGPSAPAADGLGVAPEDSALLYCAVLEQSLAWFKDRWAPLAHRLGLLGLKVDECIALEPATLESNAELIRLFNAIRRVIIPQLEAYARVLRSNEIRYLINETRDAVANCPDGLKPAQVTASLVAALTERDEKAYATGLDELCRLSGLRLLLNRREELLGRIEAVAPDWSEAIRGRSGVHGDSLPPGDPDRAWLWRQLSDELDSRMAVSLDALEQEYESHSSEVRDLTNETIAAKSWRSQVNRTTLPNRLALTGYADIVKKIGAGHGKRVPRLRVEAREKLRQARTAVPVWIMPLVRVAESFDPRNTRFDVVVVDEASQCDVMGLMALYLGKKVVIVGDDQQVSPTPVGQNMDVVQHLIDEHLQGVPNSILYDGSTSIYDLAKQSFGRVISLREHFRCVPEIIQFSNHLSYNGNILPLRDASSLEIKPGVVSYRVINGISSNKVNKEEALSVASLMVSCMEQAEYQNSSFGAISLLGDEQALEIDSLLRRFLSEDEYVRRRVLCGNPAHFQGDERDVVFLSIVDSPSDTPPLARREFGYQDIYKKRYNVAASRARNQMWVVTSLDPAVDLKPGDIRRRLIEYSLDPSAVMRLYEDAKVRTKSPFELAVMNRLLDAGYKVIPQYKVGHYYIDLVVSGGGPQLAVECDGERYHTLEDLPADASRQAQLERLGWRFARIRGSEFYRDPDASIQTLVRRLESLGIRPEGSMVTDAPQKSDLVERVIRRAEEIAAEWRKNPDIGWRYDESRVVDARSVAEVGVSRDHSRPPRTIGNDDHHDNMLPGQSQLALEDHATIARVAEAGESDPRSLRRKPGSEPVGVDRTARKKPKPNSPARSANEASRRSVPEPKPEVHTELPTDIDHANIQRISSIDADIWFSMSHWAKENGYLFGWERRLLFSLGRIVARGQSASVKQARQGVRIYDECMGLGFVSDK